MKALWRFFRSKNFLNAGASAGSFAIKPLLQLITVPIVFRHLGEYPFGSWMVVQGVIGLASLVDFGFSPATTLLVARHHARGERLQVLGIIQNSWTVFILAAGTLLAVAVCVGPLLLRWLRLSPNPFSNSLMAALAIGLCAAVTVAQSGLDSILRGIERFDCEAALKTSGSVISQLAIVGTAVFGSPLLTILWIYTSVQIVFLVFTLIVVSNVVGSQAWIRPSFQFHGIREFFSIGFYGGLQGLSSIVLQQGDKLVLSNMLGPEIAGFYSVLLQIISLIHGLLTKAFFILFPKFAGLSLAPVSASARVFYKGMAFSTMLGASINMSFYLAGPFLISRWLSMPLTSEQILCIRILAFFNAFMSTTIVPYTLVLGVGLFRLAAFTSFLNVLAVMAAMVAFIPLYGLPAAAFSRLALVPVSMVTRVLMMRAAFGCGDLFIGIRHTAPVLLCFIPLIWKHFHNAQSASAHQIYLDDWVSGIVSFLVLFATTWWIYHKPVFTDATP